MDTAIKNYYDVLGVGREASADDIKKAFRRLARKHHPDVNPGAEAAARMAEVNEANTVLSDPQRRADYDAELAGRGQRRQGAQGQAGGAGGWQRASAQGFEGVDEDTLQELFEQMFARGAAGAGVGGLGRGGGHAGFEAAGLDQHARMELELEDAWAGVRRQLTLRLPEVQASGQVGLVERTLEVRIPAGVRPGQMIRLAGQGRRAADGRQGDLYLEVALRPHARFALRGADLLTGLPLAPWEAALGAVVPVSLPDGSALKVRVPAQAQAGQTLTVRGRGWPAGGGKPAGDLELRLEVLLPSSLEPRAKALYERMAEELGQDFDARKVAAAQASRSAR